MSRFPKSDDDYNEHGQDARPPSLEERGWDQDMTPGMDEQPRWQLRKTPFGVVELWVPRGEDKAA